MVRKKRVNDGGPQTLKQAKAAFKTRGSTSVSESERRQLERGAVLLERAERIKDQEQRRKEILKKKTNLEAKAAKPCLLGTQRRLDKFGYKSSQFHLGAFLKAKAPTPLPVVDEDPAEPWEEDEVDDDTLLDFAGESPVAAFKQSAELPTQPTPTKLPPNNKLLSPSPADDFGIWDDFLERSSQIARELSSDHKSTPPTPTSFNRIPSFTSADFDLSVDDLEELDLSVQALAPQPKPLEPAVSRLPGDKGDRTTQPSEKEMDRRLMPPPKIPAKCLPPRRVESSARPSAPQVAHGISLADLETLAGEEIQLSQFDAI